MAENETYMIKNRSAGVVVYTLPERNVRRIFQPGEVKKISKEELIALSYISGGKELMSNYLMIQDDKAVQELSIAAEQEYWLNEQQIIELLQTGTLDEFLDTLDFAPAGVIDLIKNFSVSLPLTDLNKIDALRQKTGFDVTKALLNIREDNESGEQETVSEAPKRRVTKKKVENKYKVVS